jgi:hypothetical protein
MSLLLAILLRVELGAAVVECEISSLRYVPGQVVEAVCGGVFSDGFEGGWDE